MIREARIADLPQVMALGARLVPQTVYRDIELDRESVTKTFGQCLQSQLGFAMVAEHDDGLTGILLGVADRLWWARARYASDLVFYSERAGDGLALLRRFIQWAWSVPGVMDITLAQSSGINVERSESIYRRAGLERVGGLWCMRKS